MSLSVNHFYRFGEFTLDTDQKTLRRGDRPQPLTPKMFETLLILVENHGRIVEKEALMRRLWPDSFVEDANRTFNSQQLRKALGDDARHPLYIETVPRRGYRFTADVEELLLDASATGLHTTLRFETAGDRSPAVSKRSVVCKPVALASSNNSSTSAVKR